MPRIIPEARDTSRCPRPTWGGGLEEPGFELLTVSAVVDPVAGRRDPLTGRDRGGLANQGDQLTVRRLIDEERLLARNLPGYVGYQKKVRYRLIPLVW
jgi:protein-S-isoprenylcysteine O-methyltransferase Ste14